MARFLPLSSADLTINTLHSVVYLPWTPPPCLYKTIITRRCCFRHTCISPNNSDLKWGEMIHISRKPEFSNCGSMNCTSSDQSIEGGRSRQRSHSYYSPEDCKVYGTQVQTAETNLRPRSRYVLTIRFYCTFSPYLFSISVSFCNRGIHSNLQWITYSPGHFTVLRHQNLMWDHRESGPVSSSSSKRKKKGVVVRTPLRNPSLSWAKRHQENWVVNILLELFLIWYFFWNIHYFRR